MSPAWARAIRRGIVPVILGIAAFALSWPAIEDLDPLLKAVGAILVAIGLVIIVASGRTYAAEEERIGGGSLAGRPAKPSPEG